MEALVAAAVAVSFGRYRCSGCGRAGEQARGLGESRPARAGTVADHPDAVDGGPPVGAAHGGELGELRVVGVADP